MIETTLLEYFSSKLDVDVYMEKPDVKPSSYVLLEKTGSTEVNHIPTATIAIQSYAPTMAEAAALNQLVKAAAKQSIELPEISAVRLNSDYNFTDTSTKEYRYQAVYVFTYYDN